MTVELAAVGDEVSCAGDELLGGDFVGEAHKVFAELEARVLIAALARHPQAALHAAVLGWADRAWLLVAEHAVGKTTTALALAQQSEGAVVLGDDVALLDDDGATAFERPLRLRSPTVTLLGIEALMARAGRWDTADEVFRVDPAVFAPARDTPELPQPVTDVLLLSRDGTGVEPTPSAHALPALLGHRFQTALDPAATLSRVTSLVADARVWSVGVDRPPLPLADLLLDAIAR